LDAESGTDILTDGGTVGRSDGTRKAWRIGDDRSAGRFFCISLALLCLSCSREHPKPPPDLPAIGGQVSLLRFPSDGGPLEAYNPDSLTTATWSSLPLPAVRRALGANLDERLVWALDAQGNLIGVDLESRLVRKGPTGVRLGSVGPDGSLYLADATLHIVRMGRREEVKFHDPLPAAPRALYPAVNDQVVAITSRPARLITAGADQQAHIDTIPTGEVAATTWGDLVAVANDSGVKLYETGGQRNQRSLPIDHAKRIAFSPSGHRLYVSRDDDKIKVVDRFTLTDLEPIRLPGIPREFKLDASGRWMMVHREAGDSVWVIDLTTGKLVGSVLSEWGTDLPLVAGAGSLLVRQGDDVVRIDLRQATPTETARLKGGGEDYWLAVFWVPPERIPAAIAAAESASVVQDSALVTDVAPAQPDSVVMYLQVSRTQNAEWAQLLMKQLKSDGYPASILDPTEPEDGFRVVVGPFAIRETADSVGRAMGRPYFVLRLPAKRP